MKRFYLLLFLLPLVGATQVLRVTEVETTGGNKRLETGAVTLKASSSARMDAYLSTDGSALFLTLTGSGAGAGTIDKDNEAILLLDNGQQVTVRSIGVQGIENKGFVNTYKHSYAVSPEDLVAMSRFPLKGIRKYSLMELQEFEPDTKNRESLKTLSSYFLQEMEKRRLRAVTASASAPAFPGGEEVYLQFLNRNLKLDARPATGRLRAVVQFRVGADGSVSGMEIAEPAGSPYDNELLRILGRMPRWKPAAQDGRGVESVVRQAFFFYPHGAGLSLDVEKLQGGSERKDSE